MEKITSLQNNRIKHLVKLQKPSERALHGLFTAEGCKEITMAIDNAFTLESLYWCRDMGSSEGLLNRIKSASTQIFEITKEVFSKIAYRENSDGLFAVIKPKTLHLHDVILKETPLLLVLESVEKPGNLGAILRTADAAMVDAVIICDKRTEIYNPNVVRSSLGCIFTKQVVTCSNTEALAWLKAKNIAVFAAALANDAKPYHQSDFAKPVALVMGTEADGLSDFWLQHCNSKIIIPMLGQIDSLNVSVSAAVLTFEAVRQRLMMVQG